MRVADSKLLVYDTRQKRWPIEQVWKKIKLIKPSLSSLLLRLCGFPPVAFPRFHFVMRAALVEQDSRLRLQLLPFVDERCLVASRSLSQVTPPLLIPRIPTRMARTTSLLCYTFMTGLLYVPFPIGIRD